MPVADLVFGAVGAVVFALIIHALPGSWLEPKSATLAIVFLVAALLSPVFVWTTGRLGKMSPLRLRDFTLASLVGATIVDSTAVAFFPALYGHEGGQLAMGAAVVLWGVFWFGLSAYAFARRAS